MDRYEDAERKVENEAEELMASWDLRIRTLTELKSAAGTLGTSSSYIENAKMFYDGEKVDEDEDTEEILEETDKLLKEVNEEDDNDWSSKSAKEDIFDKFADWLTEEVTGEKASPKTQGEEVIGAQLTAMSLDEQNILADIASDYQTAFRGLASADRINEALENFEEEPVFGIKNNTNGISNANLDQETIDKILSTPKGYRPAPLTYLSKDYIDQHLKQFENGASYIMPKSDYDFYYRGVPEISRPDGTMFFAPKDYMDTIRKEANGDISVIEEKLGYPSGSLPNGDFTIINVHNLKDYNMHIPSGNEHGANSEWIPGGYTSGGIPEVILEHVPNDIRNIEKVFLERK